MQTKRPSAAPRRIAAKRPNTVGRPRKDAASKADALGPQRIFRAVLDVVDAHGLNAFNIRSVAQHLGVAPSAVHWHVPTRAGLISGAIRLALQNVAVDGGGAKWQDRIALLMHRFRAALRRHPHLAPAVASELGDNATFDTDLVECVVAALEEARFEGAALIDAFNVVVAAMCGFATMELSTVAPDAAAALQQDCKQRLQAVNAKTHPALHRHRAALANKAFLLRWTGGAESPLESGFDAWVDIVIRGLESRRRSLR